MKHWKNVWSFLKRMFKSSGQATPPTPPTPSPLPDNGVYRTAKEVRAKLRKQLAGKLSKSVKIYLPDMEYYCPSVKYVNKVLSENDLDKYLYSSARFDCDDYAICLKAVFAKDAYRNGTRRAPHCFGIVHGLLPGPHAVNFMINDDGIVRFCEPQTDLVFLPGNTHKGIWLLMA